MQTHSVVSCNSVCTQTLAGANQSGAMHKSRLAVLVVEIELVSMLVSMLMLMLVLMLMMMMRRQFNRRVNSARALVLI